MQISSRQRCVAHVCPIEYGAHEFCATHVRASEPRIRQDGAAKVSLSAVNRPQVRATQVRLSQVSAAKVRPAEFGVAKIGTRAEGIPKIRPAKTGAAEVSAPQVGANAWFLPPPFVPRRDALTKCR